MYKTIEINFFLNTLKYYFITTEKVDNYIIVC